MPTDLLAALPQLTGIVEKAGVIGVLLIVVGWLLWDRMRLLKELKATHTDRAYFYGLSLLYKAACDNAHPPIKVDTSSLSAPRELAA